MLIIIFFKTKTKVKPPASLPFPSLLPSGPSSARGRSNAPPVPQSSSVRPGVAPSADEPPGHPLAPLSRAPPATLSFPRPRDLQLLQGLRRGSRQAEGEVRLRARWRTRGSKSLLRRVFRQRLPRQQRPRRRRQCDHCKEEGAPMAHCRLLHQSLYAESEEELERRRQ